MYILQAIFLGMFIYGMSVGMPGTGLLALSVFVFNLFAGRKFAADDKAWATDPRNADVLGPSTSDALVGHDCECVRSEI